MPDKSFFLITTADERSWLEDDHVLFLGEWCRPYAKKNLWEKLHAEIAPSYGWDKGQQKRDYAYVQNVCESLLPELSDALNALHETEHSSRYWRIILGAWLHRFVAIMFNRWASIQFVLERYKIASTVVLEPVTERMIPLDYLDFARLYRTDLWNHAMYGVILREWTDVSCKLIAAGPDDHISNRPFTPEPSSTFKRKIKRLISGRTAVLEKMLSRSTDAFLISTYLPFIQECRLHLSLGQFPILRLSPSAPKILPDPRMRNRFRLATEGFLGFEKFIREIIPRQMPACHLEGYSALLETVDSLPWPDKPKLIFTSNNFDSDETFKAWTAAKAEAGVPYIIGQHGANYGTAQYAPSETHEVATADRFLTWGWEDNNIKHYPVVAFPIVGKLRRRWNPQGGLVLVERIGGHREEPWDEVPAFKQYLEEQFQFLEALQDNINKEVTVRLYAAHLCLSWSEDLIWKERKPGARLDFGTGPIGELIRQNRLTVYSYNSTGILETLAQNIPTIFFWNTAHWPLRQAARPYFDRLRDAGIFHETPESAADKVNEIWNNVGGWWNQGELQEARRLFCDRFARMPRSPIRKLREALLTVPSGDGSKHKTLGKNWIKQAT